MYFSLFADISIFCDVFRKFEFARAIRSRCWRDSREIVLNSRHFYNGWATESSGRSLQAGAENVASLCQYCR